MPEPIYDGSVDYDDGTDNNAKQLTEDVVTFLKWAAEPELEVRKNLGIKVILFFLVLGTVIYLAKNRLWREVRTQRAGTGTSMATLSATSKCASLRLSCN